MRSQSEREKALRRIEGISGSGDDEEIVRIEYLSSIPARSGDQGRYLGDRTGSDSAGQDIT